MSSTVAKQVCGARTQSGGECQRKGLENGRCSFHGGKSLSGPSHPRWKHGRGSQLYRRLPVRLRDAYAATLEDPQPLTLLHDIALLDARGAELVDGLTSGEAGADWEQMERALARLSGALNKTDVSDKDVEKARDEVADLQDLLTKRADEGKLWKELQSLVETRRSLVETERKRIESEETSLGRGEVLAFTSWLIHVLLRHVQDAETIEKVIKELRKHLGPDALPSGEDVTELGK